MNSMNQGSSCSQPQAMVDRGPAYEKGLKRRKRTDYQVMSKSNIIRPDKRNKVRYI